MLLINHLDWQCFFIAIVDLVFIINAVGFGGIYGHNIPGISTDGGGYVASFHGVDTSFLGHPISFTIFYINIISSIPASILCTFRSLNRMVAIYFPLYYS